MFFMKLSRFVQVLIALCCQVRLWDFTTGCLLDTYTVGEQVPSLLILVQLKTFDLSLLCPSEFSELLEMLFVGCHKIYLILL